MSGEKPPYKKGGYRPMWGPENIRKFHKDIFPGKSDLIRNYKKGRRKGL